MIPHACLRAYSHEVLEVSSIQPHGQVLSWKAEVSLIASADDDSSTWTIAGAKKRKPIDQSKDDTAQVVYLTGE